jgi:ribonuclease M5
MAENKLRIREVIVVEGRYDRNTLSQVVDALIFETNGFAVFNDREKLDALRMLAEERGLILLTDSDSAGFVIRNRLKSMIPLEKIKQAFVPAVPGREKRKNRPSKEGLLGVEGMRPEELIRALKNAGASEDNCAEEEKITDADFYRLGLNGRPGSAQLRRRLAQELHLPPLISRTDLQKTAGFLLSREELEALVSRLTRE